jgi:heparan sulfate 6-O-sulfotransferase HS6ST1
MIYDMKKSVSVQVLDSDLTLFLVEKSGIYEIKKMDSSSSKRRKIRSIIFMCLVLAVAGIVGFGYFCTDQVRRMNKSCIIDFAKHYKQC